MNVCHNKGFTTIELLIGVTITLIIIFGASQFFNDSFKAAKEQEIRETFYALEHQLTRQVKGLLSPIQVSCRDLLQGLLLSSGSIQNNLDQINNPKLGVLPQDLSVLTKVNNQLEITNIKVDLDPDQSGCCVNNAKLETARINIRTRSVLSSKTYNMSIPIVVKRAGPASLEIENCAYPGTEEAQCISDLKGYGAPNTVACTNFTEETKYRVSVYELATMCHGIFGDATNFKCLQESFGQKLAYCEYRKRSGACTISDNDFCENVIAQVNNDPDWEQIDPPNELKFCGN